MAVKPPDLPRNGVPGPSIDWQAFVFAVGGLAVIAIAFWSPRDAAWLPPCLWTALRGHRCPFCGVTRSFQSMTRGAWGQAFVNNPLGPLLFAVLLWVIVRNGWCWARSLRKPAR